MRIRRQSGTCMALVLLLVASALPALGQRPMTIVDLIDVPALNDPQISPTGAQVVYLRADADWEKNETVTHLWRVNADGSGSVQLTHGEASESSPRWSPDGRRIAFLTKRGEAEERQIYLLPNEGGEAAQLTRHPTEVSRISWSPDGRWIYFIAPDDKTVEEKAREQVKDNVFAFDEDWKHRHLWRVSPDDGRTERITTGTFTVLGYQLSSDGTRLVLHRAPTPLLDDTQLSELWVMTAAGGEARQLTENRISETGAELSPDNSRILFVANSNPDFDYYYNSKLFVMPASGGRPAALLPDLPHEINAARWSPDGRSIYFLANTGVRQELFQVDVDSRRVTQLTRGDHTVSDWSFHPALNRHTFTISSPTDPGEVWSLDPRGGLHRVTRVFDHITREFSLPRTEAIRWLGEDGETVEGLLFYPLGYREGQRYPLVVQTHGGPAASDKFSWHSASNYVPVLTAMGYAVLKPNYRGSTGYGDDFLRNMVGNYFDQAHKDVMAGVDHLIALGIADGERMAKMGWSAGGHMTNKIITYTDRFKAASSGAGAINWISMYAQSDTRVYRTPWFGGTPWQEDAPLDVYLAASPLVDLHKVTTPTLVLVGQNDERVPMAQSVELFRALRSNGVPTRLYVAPRQGHGWRELQQRLFKANAELDWFERYVRQRDYSWELSPVHPEQQRDTTTTAVGGR